MFFWKASTRIIHVFINRANLSLRKRAQWARKILWSSKWHTGLQGNYSTSGPLAIWAERGMLVGVHQNLRSFHWNAFPLISFPCWDSTVICLFPSPLPCLGSSILKWSKHLIWSSQIVALWLRKNQNQFLMLHQKVFLAGYFSHIFICISSDLHRNHLSDMKSTSSCLSGPKFQHLGWILKSG